MGTEEDSISSYRDRQRKEIWSRENIKLDRRDVREKPKYLVRQKECMVEKDTWKKLENLENPMELVEKFEKEIKEEEISGMTYPSKVRKKVYLYTEWHKRTQSLGVGLCTSNLL